MQNMFSTLNINSQPVKTTNAEVKQGTGLELLNNLTGTAGTMDFNTMQRMMASNPPANQGLNLGSDFNTMQNLFATGQNPQISAQLQYGNPQLPQANFYSVQNLYGAGQNQGVTLTQPTYQAPTSNPSSLDNFNTMQNLFSTNSQVKTPQTGGIASQPALNLENVNIQDYNTMQNLFKTGSVSFVPPTTTMTATTPITPITKSEDAFGLLDLSQKSQVQNPSHAMFNTYSGPKNTGNAQIDLTAFGTMQKGTAPLNPIDFLNMNTVKQEST